MYWLRPYGRSEVIAENGMVATSQPLATQVGIHILQSGGNAVDAAIAAAAVLDVTEPFSTGCGGDAFALLFSPNMKVPLSFNGSGKSGYLASLDDLLDKGWNEMPLRGGPTVTVPGALHLWDFMVKEYGNLKLGDVLAPAIGYAQCGFPVSPIIAAQWKMLLPVLTSQEAIRVYTMNGIAPKGGDIVRNSDLAATFQEVANSGTKVFYEGSIAEKIVNTVQQDGGFLTLDDLKSHKTEITKPISTTYNGLDVFEHPPNGQGFAALAMMNIMEELNIQQFDALSADRFHFMIEAKKLAYADLGAHNADPDFYNVPSDIYHSKKYAKIRVREINSEKTMDPPDSGINPRGDTIYLTTADSSGLVVSFINSLYLGFGSGLVVPGTGIKLQNRGSLFSLDPEHPNCYAPKKRPFHTIIPAILKGDDFYGAFGIMGGSHQAQAHAQFVSNLIDFGMPPQHAMDFPRFHHDQNKNTVSLENGIPSTVHGELRKRGHQIIHETMSGFGGGQVILRKKGVWIGGSDHRKDGQAAGF